MNHVIRRLQPAVWSLRSERRAIDLLWFAAERGAMTLVRPRIVHRLVRWWPAGGRRGSTFSGPDSRTADRLRPPLSVSHHRHGQFMQLRSTDVLARMESSYAEAASAADLIDVLDGLLHRTPGDPVWTPYAMAVRGRSIARVLAEDRLDRRLRRRLRHHARTHQALLAMVSERHLHHNHRTTIEFGRLALAESLADSKAQSRAARRFAAHCLEGLGTDGAPKEGSFSYGLGLLDEMLLAVNRYALAELEPAALSLSKVLGQTVFSDGSTPAFGDSFPGRFPAAASGASVVTLGRVVRVTHADFELAVSLGSIGPRGFGGHGHLDAGSFELFHRDHGLLVADVGCTRYASSVTRAYERSYLSHNMPAAIWPLAQQPVWGAFAYRRISGLTSHRVVRTSADRVSVEVTVEHRSRSGDRRITIVRRLTLDDTGLTVEDEVTGDRDGQPIVRSFAVGEAARMESSGPSRFTTRRPTSAQQKNLAVRSPGNWRLYRQRFTACGLGAVRLQPIHIGTGRCPQPSGRSQEDRQP